MINILLFAQLREDIGTDSLELDKAGITIKELKQFIQETYKTQSLDQVMTAVNEEFSMDDNVLKAGDTVAFIPPVSGG